MNIYHDMLRMEIQEDVNIWSHKTLFGLVEEAKERERELDTQQQKRKHVQVHASAASIKKARETNFQSGDRETRGFYVRCGLVHQGIFAHQFLNVSDAVRRVTTVGTVVRGS